MKTMAYKVYKFKELPKEVQKKAVENYHDINIDNEYWHDYTTDDYKEKLEKLGYNDPEIYFSGFWSQGDGACFTAKSIDIQKWLKAHKLAKKYSKLADVGDFTGSITHNYRYYFSTSSDVNVYANNDYVNQYTNKVFTPKQRDQISDLQQFLEKEIEKEREKLGNEIYKQLEKVYQELTSDDAIIETLEINDYDFTIDGKID